jgi:carbon monoxide dehydrogenase subunit G
VTIDVEHTYPVSRETLWDLLHDPVRMAAWIPGCEKLDAVGPDRYAATMKIGVAAVKGTYTGFVQVADKQYPSSYSLTVDGSAPLGIVRGVATLELSELANCRTRLRVRTEAQVGGLIASVGQRFLSGIARQLTEQVLRNIEKEAVAS